VCRLVRARALCASRACRPAGRARRPGTPPSRPPSIASAARLALRSRLAAASGPGRVANPFLLIAWRPSPSCPRCSPAFRPVGPSPRPSLGSAPWPSGPGAPSFAGWPRGRPSSLSSRRRLLSTRSGAPVRGMVVGPPAPVSARFPAPSRFCSVGSHRAGHAPTPGGRLGPSARPAIGHTAVPPSALLAARPRSACIARRVFRWVCR